MDIAEAGSSSRLVVVALVVAAALTMFARRATRKTLTAHFPRTVSIYEGSDVRVLGVPIGTVDSVTPSGTDVVVTMSYDADVEIPADAKAVIVSPVDRGRPLRAADPGLHRRRRCSPTARLSTRTRPRCRSSSTRSTPASTT